MKMSYSSRIVSGILPAFSIAVLSVVGYGQHAQISKPTPSAIVLEPASGTPAKPNLPDNFRMIGGGAKGQAGKVETLTLKFVQSSDIMSIKGTRDFVVQKGGSCDVGVSYAAGAQCTLLVKFEPQGPGNRVGKILIGHTASVMPFAIGLAAVSRAPAVSFAPAVISTVPATYPNGVAVLNGASGLAVDGGDLLYIADTGNGLVRYIDPSGTLQTIDTHFPIVPSSIAVDGSGAVYVVQQNPSGFVTVDIDGVTRQYADGNDYCSYGDSCDFEVPPVVGAIATDPYGTLFLNEGYDTAQLQVTGPGYISEFTRLENALYSEPAGPNALAVDGNDNLYTYDNETSGCSIAYESYDNAKVATLAPVLVVGGRGDNCSFSGDGGPARGATVGESVGQMTFDLAGNLFFTDTGNQRVRRIDGLTGIITTVAGNGATGYSGDGGPANAAALNYPTGLAVDSQGDLYVTSNAGGGTSVVRKVGPDGILNFAGTQTVGTSSTVQTIRVSNSGNDNLTFTNTLFGGANGGDFALDPATTSCILSQGSNLYLGQSCQIGVIFKPTGAGARTATLTLVDNTVTNTNVIHLNGSAVAAAVASISITSPAPSSTSAFGTPVTFAVTVTSTGTAPTGTVTFNVDGTPVGSPVALSGGAASVVLNSLSAASHTLSATYNGDANYAPQTASESISVTAAPPPPACAPTSQGVKICSPTAGASVSSPVTIMAGAKTSSGHITAIRIYVDTVAKVTLNDTAKTKTFSISQAITLTSGTHKLSVVGYQSGGGSLKATETITVP